MTLREPSLNGVGMLKRIGANWIFKVHQTGYGVRNAFHPLNGTVWLSYTSASVLSRWSDSRTANQDRAKQAVSSVGCTWDFSTELEHARGLALELRTWSNNEECTFTLPHFEPRVGLLMLFLGAHARNQQQPLLSCWSLERYCLSPSISWIKQSVQHRYRSATSKAFNTSRPPSLLRTLSKLRSPPSKVGRGVEHGSLPLRRRSGVVCTVFRHR